MAVDTGGIGNPALKSWVRALERTASIGRDPLLTLPALIATLADRFWPGPLTLVLPRSAAIPDVVTAGLRNT